MCIYTLGTWRPFPPYCIQFGCMPKNYLQAKGRRERQFGPPVSPGSRTRVWATGQESSTIHTLQLMISRRNACAAASSTTAQTAAPKHVPGQCLRSPLLSWKGFSTPSLSWEGIQYNTDDLLEESSKKEVTQKLPQTYVLAHCLVYYKTKHIWGVCLVDLQRRCVMTYLSACKMKLTIKRQRINTDAQPSSVLWHHSHCMTFVDLTRLWP